MAVASGEMIYRYLAPKGWRPKNADERYVITLVKVEMSDYAYKKARKAAHAAGLKFSEERLFEMAADNVAAESSTGTWTKVFSGKGSGVELADRERALAYDLDYNKKMFKIAYPVDIFELGNMSGFLAGVAGNIAGMKILSGLRIYDIRMPKKFVKSFSGPAFGVEGVRRMLGKPKGYFYVITVPKPKIGRTAREQAWLARTLFNAGKGTYDGIKDDENLTSLYFNKFDDRAKLVLKEQAEAEKKTGRKKFCLLNITHSNIAEMIRRAEVVKKNGGRFMMMDVVTTGFAAVDTMRKVNPGLAIHAHRAMHAFLTRDNSPGVQGRGAGKLYGFSISMIVLAKIFRMLGVDSLHGGSPLAKMEDYGEAKYIQQVLQNDIVELHDKIPSLGQKWYGVKPVLMTASGGLHPGDIEAVARELGEDVIMQFGGGLLGHPFGIEAGVKAVEQARELHEKKISLKKWVGENPNSELAAAVKHWGYGPGIYY